MVSLGLVVLEAELSPSGKVEPSLEVVVISPEEVEES